MVGFLRMGGVVPPPSDWQLSQRVGMQVGKRTSCRVCLCSPVPRLRSPTSAQHFSIPFFTSNLWKFCTHGGQASWPRGLFALFQDGHRHLCDRPGHVGTAAYEVAGDWTLIVPTRAPS